MIIKRLLISGLVILLIGCKADDLEVDDSQASQSTPEGVAAPLTNSEYQNLKPEKQYQVANKLAATMFNGVSVYDFFDFNVYGDNLKTSDLGNEYMSTIREDIVTQLKNKADYNNKILARHTFNDNDLQRAKAFPLAILKEYPSSRERFEVWMAYVLMNTVLFSPAAEIETTNYIDIQNIFNKLVESMSEDASIRNIVLAHMKSEANWRRFLVSFLKFSKK